MARSVWLLVKGSKWLRAARRRRL